METSSPNATGIPPDTRRAKKLYIMVGAFVCLAVAMWFVNTMFGPEHLQSNLVTSGNYAIGTERKEYVTSSGSVLQVPVQVLIPAGEQLKSVRLLLGPWPAIPPLPAFVFSDGIAGTSRVTVDGKVLEIRLENIEGYGFERMDLGRISMLSRPDASIGTVHLLSAANAPQSTRTELMTADARGALRTTVFETTEFFRVSQASDVAAVPSAGDLSAQVSFGNLASPSSFPSSPPLSATATGSDLHAVAGNTFRAPVTGVDLGLTAQSPAGGVSIGDVVSARFILHNRGTQKIKNVKLDITAPKELRIVDFTTDGCALAGTKISCAFPETNAAQIIPVVVEVRSTAQGFWRLVAKVKTDESEADMGNNEAEAEIYVTPPATGASSVTPSPTPHPSEQFDASDSLPQTGPMWTGVLLIAIGTGVVMLTHKDRPLI